MHAGVEAPPALIDALTTYFELLAHWNQKINLTAFDLTSPSDAAIDRLVVEPVESAPFVRHDDRVALDVGSGGGSPALPLKLAAPWLQMTLVEARTRKSAFLREAVRVLGLSDVDVQTFRFEAGAIPAHWDASVDLVTMRAVKVGIELLGAIRQVLSERGRLLVFGQLVVNQKTSELPGHWEEEILKLKTGTDLTLLSKAIYRS